MSIIRSLAYYIYDAKFLYQLLATLTVFIAIRIGLFFRGRHKRFQLLKYYNIPGPKTDLLGGNFDLFHNSNAKFLVNEKLMIKYGKTHGIYIGDLAFVYTVDLEFLKKVFLEKMGSFKMRTRLFLDTLLHESILFAPYDRWKVMRKVISPWFSGYQMRGGNSVQFIEDSIKLMLEYIDNQFRINQSQGDSTGKIRLDIQDLMKATALHMISSMAIKLPNVQVKESEENVRSLDAFLQLTEGGPVTYAIRFPFIGRILSCIAEHFDAQVLALIHRGVNKTIDEGLKKLRSRRKSVDSSDLSEQQEVLIDAMIKLHYQGILTRKEVIANADAVLFAGYDTTSTTLAYVFWVLAKYPDVQKRVRDELMTSGVDSIYLDQVLNETMRLYPTVISFASRQATETVDINGQTLPQGTIVVYNSWLVHRHPEIWPDPLEFNPDRFKPGAEIHPCAFAPFGLGDRKCLGYQLAKLEMKMVVCDVLLGYSMKLISPPELELISYANVLTKPRKKVILEFERLQY